jgi:hypothetical protein
LKEKYIHSSFLIHWKIVKIQENRRENYNVILDLSIFWREKEKKKKKKKKIESNNIILQERGKNITSTARGMLPLKATLWEAHELAITLETKIVAPLSTQSAFSAIFCPWWDVNAGLMR